MDLSDSPYKDMSILEILHDYFVVRGDLEGETLGQFADLLEAKVEQLVQAAMPESDIEYRVRYVFQDEIPASTVWTRRVHTFADDSWFTPDMDGAAAYTWLMNNTIAWVEQRTIYESGEWSTV